MQMETVTVIKRHPYGREMRRPGQVCQVEARHAPILEKAGLIERKAKPIIKRPLPIETREMDSEDEDKPQKKKKRRTYRRMDLRAED